MSIILSGDNGVTFPNATVQASAGSVLQVVNAAYSTSVTTSSTSFVDTGLTATITPKFSTSKILVIAQVQGFQNIGAPSGGLAYQIVRGATAIFTQTNYGQYIAAGGTSASLILTNTFTYLDSPTTTSATAYKVQFFVSNALYAGTAQYSGNPSVITLMEIAS
jgi:hypothetical protein